MKVEMTNNENKNLKKMEEAELKVVLFDENDVVVASGECTGCTNYENTGCLAAGTLITMADGSVKNIEDICENDMILAFDHEAGRYVSSPILYNYKSDTKECSYTLSFSNNSTLSIVGEHDLFELESNQYVTITKENANTFVGKHFYSVTDKAYVELINVTQETEATDYYEIYTAKTLNMVANGMLNVADDVDYLLNVYEFKEDLSADMEALQKDIEQYGLVTFSERYAFTQEEFDAWNMRYVNISLNKGLISAEKLWNTHLKYLDQKGFEGISECA